VQTGRWLFEANNREASVARHEVLNTDGMHCKTSYHHAILKVF